MAFPALTSSPLPPSPLRSKQAPEQGKALKFGGVIVERRPFPSPSRNRSSARSRHVPRPPDPVHGQRDLAVTHRPVDRRAADTEDLAQISSRLSSWALRDLTATSVRKWPQQRRGSDRSFPTMFGGYRLGRVPGGTKEHGEDAHFTGRVSRDLLGSAAPAAPGRTLRRDPKRRAGRRQAQRPTTTRPRSPRWPGRPLLTEPSLSRRAIISSASLWTSARSSRAERRLRSSPGARPRCGVALGRLVAPAFALLPRRRSFHGRAKRFERRRPLHGEGVPNDTHPASILVLSEGSFSQSFDLWSLRRVPPSAAVLYRDPTRSSLAGSAAGPTTLSLANPADGFTSSAAISLQSATLGFFAPNGTTLSPNPDQAVLSVVLDGESPGDPNDPTGSGHYLGSTAPLPASLLSFTPTRVRAALTATRHGERRRRHDEQGQLRRRPLRCHLLVPRPGHADHPGTPPKSPPDRSPERSSRSTPEPESGTTTLEVSVPTSLALSFEPHRWPRPPSAPRR